MRGERFRGSAYCILVLAAALLLVVAVLWENPPKWPVQYDSVHPSSSVSPLMGFAPDSVFNVGSAEDLQQFPGIGEVLSQRIVEGRHILGDYRLPEELTLVKGIGEKTLQKLLDFLTEDLVELPWSEE